MSQQRKLAPAGAGERAVLRPLGAGHCGRSSLGMMALQRLAAAAAAPSPGLAAVAAADRAAADRQPAPGDRADGALFAQGGGAARGAGRARQRPAARPPGRTVLGHRRGADGAGRDLRLAAVPERPRILVLRPRARSMLENTVQVAQVELRPRSRSGGQRDRHDERATLPDYLAADADRRSALRRGLRRRSRCSTATSPKRSSSPTAPDKQIRTLALVNPYDRPLDKVITPAARSPSSEASAVVADQFAGPDRRASPSSITARTPISTPRACSTRSSSSRSSAPTTCCSDYQALLATIARQPAALQRRAAARRADHRRPGDLDRLEARRPPGPAGRRAGRRRGPDRGGRFLGARAGRQDRGRDPDAGDRLQPDDRPARGADRRAARRQHPARHPPRLHRGGAVERHRGRDRARYAATASC